jgi:hypothetical protein
MPDNLKVIERWRPLEHGSRDTGATVVCPSCGRDFMINNRTIDAKGIVFGRVKCPWNRRNHPELAERMNRDEAEDCDFSAEIRLEGWPPPGRLTQPT